ncbi:MAG: hypothetical protein H6838_17705 [Planctomycetes bacterium]|nr:hypothetical protein [Planctomycetota bacterium]
MRPLFSLLTLAVSATAQYQLPPVPVPSQNPMTPAKVVLGKILFWDEQLSSDDSIACGTCHVPEAGGGDPRWDRGLHPGPDGLYATDDDIIGSPGLTRQDGSGDFTADAVFGLRRQVTRRTANTNHGAAYHADLFWDGRASTTFVDPETNQTLIPFDGALESQAVVPILSPVEMGHEGRTWQEVRQKLQARRPLALALSLTPDIQAALSTSPDYPSLFSAAFGDPAITAARIAFALASYQRVLIPDDTPWDHYVAGHTTAMTPQQVQGWNLFLGIGRCNACHTPGLFTDDQFHNLGLRWKNEDRGLGAVSNVPFDDGRFKTPTLRNAGLRPRLFHNGQSAALLDPSQTTDPKSTFSVYMNGGGVDTSNLDPFLLPLIQFNVTTQDLLTIQHFVATALTDPRAAQGLPPFDHPHLRSLDLAAPRAFGAAMVGGSEPFVVDTVPANLGNQQWKLGVAAGQGLSLAYIGYGARSIEPAQWLAGLPWNIDVNDGRLLLLGGNPGDPAHATWRVPVPGDPALTNLPLFFQTWALDPQAPFGVATSRGVEITIR